MNHLIPSCQIPIQVQQQRHRHQRAADAHAAGPKPARGDTTTLAGCPNAGLNRAVSIRVRIQPISNDKAS